MAESMPKRKAVEPEQHVGAEKKCLRCDSADVKFKYFNNKKTTQPRYQCGSCKEFFTLGGKVRAPAAVMWDEPAAPPVEGVKERKRKAREPPQFVNLEKPCPGCGGTNIAFKYLNNKKVDQPRYKCLDCKKMFQFTAENPSSSETPSAPSNHLYLQPEFAEPDVSYEAPPMRPPPMGPHVMGESDVSYEAPPMRPPPMGPHVMGESDVSYEAPPMRPPPMGPQVMGESDVSYEAPPMRSPPMGPHVMGAPRTAPLQILAPDIGVRPLGPPLTGALPMWAPPHVGGHHHVHHHYHYHDVRRVNSVKRMRLVQKR